MTRVMMSSSDRLPPSRGFPPVDQLLPADSIATKLKTIAEKHSVFVVMASLLMGSMMFLACLAPAFGVRSISRVVNLMSIFTCSAACICILFVGIIISGIIRKTMKSAPETSRLWYIRASEQLWLQVRFLCGMGVVWVSSTSALELTSGGQKTPSIPLAVMFVDGCVMLSSIVHFSKQENLGPYTAIRPKTNFTAWFASKTGASTGGHTHQPGGVMSSKGPLAASSVPTTIAVESKPLSAATLAGATNQSQHRSNKVVPV